MWCKTPSILISFIVIAISGNFCFADCPLLDVTGDCFVDFDDFALMAAFWLTGDRIDTSVPDDMVLIPGRTFEMGDNFNDALSDELPVHTVTVDAFHMGKYEITNQQYCAFLNWAVDNGWITITDGVVYKPGLTRPSYPYCDTHSAYADSQIDYSRDLFSVRTKGGRDMSNDPMVMVSWYGAVAYCNWRSQVEGKQQCYDLSTWDCDFSKKGYRLATEAEWEYAARGGLAGRRFPWGDTISHSLTNYYSYWEEGSLFFPYDVNPTEGYHATWNDGVYPYTSPGGSFAANGHGLYDMAGNVQEWCNDWFDGGYYDYSPTTNPTGPPARIFRVIRGGHWQNHAYGCRVAFRGRATPDYRYPFCGIRLVLDLN